MKSWFSSIALSALQLHEMRVAYQRLSGSHIWFWNCLLIILTLSLFSYAAAESLQSCPTLCDPIDSSPAGSAIPGILQARTLECVAISFSNALKWKVKGKSLSCVRPFATPWTAAYQAPPSMGFSRQEYWSGCHCLLLFLMQRSANFSLQGYIMNTLSFETIKSLSQLFNLPL